MLLVRTENNRSGGSNNDVDNALGRVTVFGLFQSQHFIIDC